MLSNNELVDFSKNTRIQILKTVNNTKASHIASSYSIIEILTILFNNILKRDNEKECFYDRFVLSKGHAGLAIYAVLKNMGLMKNNIYETYYKNGSFLSGHVSHKKTPCIDVSTGSLGHGLGISSGMALASKIKKDNRKIFCLIGDGEFDEGSNWESLAFASAKKLNNLTLIIDNNQFQGIDKRDNINNLDFENILKDLRWETISVDGHNFDELSSAFNFVSNRPKAIIANTVKGKGVKFMENNLIYHYKDPQGKDFSEALRELSDEK